MTGSPVSGRTQPTVADGAPFAGELVAVVDESGHDAGGGVYYVVSAVVVINPAEVTAVLRALVSARLNPIHWAREGPNMRRQVIDVLCETVVAATVRWSPTGRRGQLDLRAELLEQIATWVHGEVVDHLVIEASDERTNIRDRQVLARHPLQSAGGLGYVYDHRSKREPLLWLADAVAGAVGEHLIGKHSAAFERLVAAGVIAPL